MPQPGDTGDHNERREMIAAGKGDREQRREWIAAAHQQIAAARQQIGTLQRLIDQFEAEEAQDTSGEVHQRRRFRLIRGSGAVAAVFLTLRRALLHVHGTTTAAILTAAASGALITAVAVTAPTNGQPAGPAEPGATITQSAPPHTWPPVASRPAAPPLGGPSPQPVVTPAGAPAVLPSPSATPIGPATPLPSPATITPTLPTPAAAIQPPGRRRRRRPHGPLYSRLRLPSPQLPTPACPCPL